MMAGMDMMLTDTGWDELRERWERVDSQIRTWWDADIRQAREEDVCDPAKNAVWFVDEEHRSREGVGPAADAHTLLYLPFPYISAGGSEEAFPEMYCWDVRFINRALLLHGRREIVRNHILNQLFLIQRFGFERELVTRNVVHLHGGHTIDGDEAAPLDEEAARALAAFDATALASSPRSALTIS